MGNSNHYDTLDIPQAATQVEIKQAYRRLAKQFHPDSNRAVTDHEQISRINAAYEVLSDPQRRQSYDQELAHRLYGTRFDTEGMSPGDRQRRAAEVQKRYREQYPTGQAADEHLQLWLNQVYTPVNRLLSRILRALAEEIDELSADPFDDELMEGFQEYLEDSHTDLSQAQRTFRSMPNPPNVAGVAAHLYHCLNQVSDGLEELERFTFNYDDHYLHTGQELFRIATGLRREAQAAIKNLA
ncbi:MULTISPECIES: J domain-containing protein [Trichocoleus]|uniref:J domain-containing protein n=1 Tax=Trichocoleus desertorum GB2-A4 TaxID=2933944 RepID=A0ABV0J357_9CYAN|nr:J domain-containing protein [Trichocoleus sp. FACHB-46]MBD1861542.1 J domain-containing protein [Trichocoleus sp. FACHB-46]